MSDSSDAGSMCGGMDSPSPIKYSVFDLLRFTERFSEDNFIGNTQFAMMYRGKIPCGGPNQTPEDKMVTVKLWVQEGDDNCDPENQKRRLEDELHFLQLPGMKNHPNLAPLIGYFHHPPRVAVIYDVNPIDTFQNLVVKDSFSWTQRIEVAIALGRLVDFLHSCEPPYRVCNLAAAHILIDQDFNPILVDFGMLSGGVFADRPNLRGRRILYGASGYEDFQYAACGRDLPGKRDVYAFGVLLLNLIAKRVSTEELADNPKLVNWAIREFAQPGVLSCVDESLQLETTYDWKLGYGISHLAVRCVQREQHRRPTISEAVEFLEDIVAASSWRVKLMSLDAPPVGKTLT